MKLLLDTAAFLWWIENPRKVPKDARAAIASPDNEVLLSIVSPWEIAVKASIGKLRTPGDLEAMLPDMGIELLPISLTHVAAVQALPFHHRDPFDRMLIAQARSEQAVVLTSDPMFAKYGVATLW